MQRVPATELEPRGAERASNGQATIPARAAALAASCTCQMRAHPAALPGVGQELQGSLQVYSELTQRSPRQQGKSLYFGPYGGRNAEQNVSRSYSNDRIGVQ